MPYQKVKDLPEVIQAGLQRVKYFKDDIEIEAREKFSPAIGGGKGRRGFHLLIDLSTGKEEFMQGSWGGANMFNPNNQVDLDTNSYDIPKDVIIITGSQGEKTYATLVVHTSNMVKYLPEHKEMDPRDRWILYTFAGLTSAGRRNEWERHNDKPSEDDLNRLAELGYLKRSKNGATKITTEGKNALNRKSYETIYHPSRMCA